MTEYHIEIKKTARYYTLGNLTENTKQVWFVIHGWGMDVKSFLCSFEPLLKEDIFFIAPEALNRFYVKGSGGVVGATWMTREDRLNEIKDYTAYLDSVYTQFRLDKYPALEITLLGFSQGASTATRWADATKNRIDNLIVYAGEVAPELFPLNVNSGLRSTTNTFICGTQDEYFTPHLVFKMKETYREMNFTEIKFEGKHEIDAKVLAPLTGHR